MTSYRVLSVVLVPLCWVFVSVAEEDATKPTVGGTVPTNSSGVNSTRAGEKGPGKPFHDVDSSMIQRALYVLIGITMIGVLYFLIRAVR